MQIRMKAFITAMSVLTLAAFGLSVDVVPESKSASRPTSRPAKSARAEKSVTVLDANCARQTEEFIPAPPAGKAWKMVWNDEFDGTTLDETKWSYRPDGKRKDGYWNKKAVSLDGKGRLVISALLLDGNQYTGGCIHSDKKFEHAFGYYVIRVQFQQQPGHWSAFWLQCAGEGKVGNEGRDGTEIDVFEKPTLHDEIEHNLHWDGYGKDHRSGGHKVKMPGLSQGWHTVGMWWSPEEYVFYLDGNETWRTKTGGVSQVPEYLMFSNEVGKWAGDIKKAVLPDDGFKVDYVRVYDLVDKK